MSVAGSDFGKTIWDTIEADPDQVFWIGVEQTFSYGDLAEAVRRLSGLFRTHELEPGARVVMMATDDWTTFCLWLSAILNGLVPVLLASDSGEERVGAISTLTMPKLSILPGVQLNEPWVTDLPGACLDEGSIWPVADASLATKPTFGMGAEHLAYVLFTSGSTGAPKGVVIPHEALAAQLDTVARVLQVNRASRVFNGLVFSHADGLIQGPVLAAWAGATLLRPDAPRPDRLAQDMDWLEQQRATHMITAPALLELIDWSCARESYFDRPEMVAILSSSARLPPALWDRFEARFKVSVINEYGMTETVVATHFAGALPEMGSRHTIGRPIGVDARIVDVHGHTVAKGEVGELQVRGPNLFAGYYGDPERTKAVMADGWLRTGDMARFTAGGDTVIIGRRDEAINSGGVLIQPDEIDDCLTRMPGLREVKTIGQDHGVFERIAVTAYVIEEGADVTPEAVLAHARTHLESRKVPKRVFRVEAIPKTSSGKVDRMALAQLVESAFAFQTESVGEPDVAGRVLNLAAQVFGEPAGSVKAESTQDSLAGWDSYAHTALILELEQAFDVELPVVNLMAVETLSDVITIVRAQTGDAGSKASDVSDDVPEGPIRLLHLRDAAGAAPTLSFVALPGLSGEVAHLKHLMAGLSSSIGVSGLSLDLDAMDHVASHTMQQQAEDYAQKIIDMGIAPPLVLFGASYGGFLAYETAVALRELGRDVRAVILNDTAVPWPHRRARHLHRIGHMLREWRRARMDGFEVNITAAFDVKGFGRLDLTPFHKRYHPMASQSFVTLSRYRPSRMDVPMLIFAAQNRGLGRLKPEPHLGWHRFNRAKLQTIPLGWFHFSVMTEPETARVAVDHINAFLLELRDAPADG